MKVIFLDESGEKHLSEDTIILRSYDIRKQKNEFASLVDKRKREAFYAIIANGKGN